MSWLVGEPSEWPVPSAWARSTLPGMCLSVLYCSVWILSPRYLCGVVPRGFTVSHTIASGDWVSIAEQASKEMDSAKLLILVEKLCSALEGERQLKPQLAVISQANYPRSVAGD
jgi:hypothetical protein